MYTLSEGDLAIFQAAQENANIFLSFYLGMEMMPWQLAIHHGRQPTQVCIGGFASGKAQPLDAPILTPSGWKQMAEIGVGDSVIGSAGRPVIVTGVFPRGEMDVYRLVFHDGTSAECTLDHLWTINKGRRRRAGLPAITVPLSEFIDCAKNASGQRHIFVPIIAPVQFAKQDLPLHPYLIGALIGDGGLSGASARFTSADEFIVTEVQRLLPFGCHLRKKNSADGRYDYDIQSRLEGFRYSRFLAILRELGLMGKRSYEKRVPEIYRFSSIEDRLMLLQGLMDTDGTVEHGGSSATYTTTSPGLAEDVVFLVQSLGGIARQRERITTFRYREVLKKGRKSYSIGVLLPPGMNPFKLPRKSQAISPRSDRRSGLYKILDRVEFVGQKRVQCISVDSPDGLYATQDCILTHNTAALAISAVTWTAMVPGFRFFDVAPVARQSYEMFAYLRDRLQPGVPYYDRFIAPTAKERGGARIVEKPYPKIVVCYRLPNGKRASSEMHFMSASDDAKYIRNIEGDWVCLDQAELMDDLDEAIRNLGSRTRGKRPDGSHRLGRLTLLANSGDNPALWSYYDLAEMHPEEYLALTVSTYENVHLSSEQIHSMERRTGGTAEDIDQFLRGLRPLGSGKYFPTASIKQCVNPGLDNSMEAALEKELLGYVLEKVEGAGIVTWQMPPEAGRVYLEIGDPGSGNAPDRNAPVVGVWDITEFPKKPAVLRALWWGFGNGQITPFLSRFRLWRELYGCQMRAGFDSTGMQKQLDELVFAVEDELTVGLDFSSLKALMLRAAQLLFEKGLFEIPAKIKGLGWQLARYDLPDTKIPQDIVAMIMMTAWWLSETFGWPSDYEAEQREKVVLSSPRGRRPVAARRPEVRVGR